MKSPPKTGLEQCRPRKGYHQFSASAVELEFLRSERRLRSGKHLHKVLCTLVLGILLDFFLLGLHCHLASFSMHTRDIHCHLAPFPMHPRYLHCHLAPLSMHTRDIHCHLALFSMHTRYLHCHLASFSMHTRDIYFHLAPLSVHTRYLHCHLAPLSVHTRDLHCHLAPLSMHTRYKISTSPSCPAFHAPQTTPCPCAPLSFHSSPTHQCSQMLSQSRKYATVCFYVGMISATYTPLCFDSMITPLHACSIRFQ